LIPSDGFNVKVTENHMGYLDPEVHRIKERPLLNMINKENLAELTAVERPVEGPDTGFGTIINKHPVGHDKLWRQTAQGEAHGYGAEITAKTVADKFSHQ
jgi:hypothetical protein